MIGKKVMIGMSGGVDSSVAALLLAEKGYDVTGVTMKLMPDKVMQNVQTGCCSIDDVDDARRVCYKIGIEHIVLNFTDIFEHNVIKYFVSEYKMGRTPNPCIACNNKVKFDALLNRAISLDFDYIATGHYAVIRFDEKLDRYVLYKSKSSKDQSYVLYNMTQYQLQHTLFPLEDIEKTQVRKIAAERNLIVANKPDSQEICFIPYHNHVSFIEEYTREKCKEGCFIDSNGKVLGKHSGIEKYTIGQRKGIGLSLETSMYVIDINSKDNTITLGEEGCQYSDCVEVEKTNFILFEDIEGKIRIEAKIRYGADPHEAILFKSDGRFFVKFDVPQRAITPGQSIVFYKGDLLIGGGVISKLRSEMSI